MCDKYLSFMENKQSGGFIKYIVIIAIILAVVFLSQIIGKDREVNQNWGNFTKKGNSYSDVIRDYVIDTEDWVKENVYENIFGSQDEFKENLETAGENIKNEAEEIKDQTQDQINNAKESTVYATKKALAEKILGVLGIKAEDLISQDMLCR